MAGGGTNDDGTPHRPHPPGSGGGRSQMSCPGVEKLHVRSSYVLCEFSVLFGAYVTLGELEMCYRC